MVMDEGTGRARKRFGLERKSFGARIAQSEGGTFLARTSEHRACRIYTDNPHTGRAYRGGVVAGPASHVEMKTTLERSEMMEQARENKWIRASGGVVANSDLVVKRHLGID